MADAKQSHHHPDYDQRIKALEADQETRKGSSRLETEVGNPRSPAHPLRTEMAAGDRGFFSAKNEQEAHALGVKKVALPARGRLSAKRAEQQKQRLVSPWAALAGGD
jgi:hypothetical protein